ncbi:MAG: hypothetical protein J5661_01160 [Bacteroidaceae bacterium]|nr:hypothetical protein [Bacteroidaceae bacterium]
MKKVYQTPEMMAAEMMSLSMVAATTGPNVTINSSHARVDPTELDVKGNVWDDWDE